jgi:hypothetical protein
MLRRSTAIVLGAALTGLALGPSFALGGTPNAWSDAKALAAQAGKPILVDFYADW